LPLKIGALLLEPFFSSFILQASDTKKTPRTTHIQPKSRISFGDEISVGPTLRGVNRVRRNVSAVEETPQ
jgi:hypothetical protein